MTFKQVATDFYVSPQLSLADVAAAAAQGISMIIDNRPDDEEPGQLNSSQIAAEARRLGMSFEHIPVASGVFDAEDVEKMRSALSRARGPALGYCRTGMRSVSLWALAQARAVDSASLISTAGKNGYDISKLRSRLEETS